MSSENQKARVLIVDDTLENIKVLGTILRQQGYQLNVAQNGLQALQQVQKVVPDLILLDIMMPELDGFETCKRLKADGKTRDIPVIFLTAKVETEDLVKAFDLGAVDYVTKPFNAAELLKRVESHLELTLLQKDLERRVAERTEKLRQATLRLKQEHEERLRAQQQLDQSQKLEAVAQLSAGVSHEVNSPMQAISSNLEFLNDVVSELHAGIDQYQKLMQHNKNGTLTPEILSVIDEAIEDMDLAYVMEEIPRALEKAQSGIQRVGKIVHALKTLSEASEEEKIPVDLNELIESTSAALQQEWQGVASLDLDFDAELPQVPCLPADFGQVIVHLLVNAAYAVGDKRDETGKITVRTRRKGDWAEISIADTGTGIPEEVRDKIFDPFFTTRNIGEGTGLSMARDVVVNRLDGHISFETEVGKGTTFIVRLPLDDAT